MRIALRTGGGRGVYELAGHQGDIAASDLFDHEIEYELTPEVIIPGRSTASRRQGKPRIALDERTKARTTHLYRLLSAVLLLPKPKREFKTTHGPTLLSFENYSMTAIKVDVASVTDTSVILRPTDVLLENADGLRSELNFTARMGRVLRLWEAAASSDTAFAALVRQLSEHATSKDPDFKDIERAAMQISDALRAKGDVLPRAEEQFGLSESADSEIGGTAEKTPPVAFQFGLDDELSPQEALVQRIKQWRQQAERGAAGRRFSREVADAYGYKCMFSGHRFPRPAAGKTPGVDAAHILPWSTYDLNSVRNGLCLDKQCHWAFDQGVLRLSFDEVANTYVVGVPRDLQRAAKGVSFDIEYFEALAGPVPVDRLPRNQASWPSPKYIAELGRFMDRKLCFSAPS